MLQDVVASRVVAVVQVAAVVSIGLKIPALRSRERGEHVQGGCIDNLGIHDTRSITNSLRGNAVMSKPHHDFVLGDRAVGGIFFETVEEHINGNVGVE